MREQNRELLASLADLSEREEEARRLNAELAETNRGVVALYAELEAQAGQLREAGATLESQVSERTMELAQANERLTAEAAERERHGRGLAPVPERWRPSGSSPVASPTTSTTC